MERLLQEAGGPVLFGAVASAMVCLVALAVALAGLVQPTENRVADRLRKLVGQRPAEGGARARFTREVSTGVLARMLAALSRPIRPATEEDASSLAARLVHAGLRGPRAMEVFLGSKIALSAALAAVPLVLDAVAGPVVPHAAAVSVVLAALGFVAPNLWLSARVKERKTTLGRSLPDALDLLVTCVEAGLGIEGALSRVVDEIVLTSPLLGRELNQTLLEIRAGVARDEAFRRLANRTGVDEMRNFSASIIQTEMFGTSVAKALRVLAESMRERRTQRAEEAAATVSTKMLIPLILCVLPSLFAVILGPAVVRIVTVLLPTLGGGR